MLCNREALVRRKVRVEEIGVAEVGGGAWTVGPDCGRGEAGHVCPLQVSEVCTGVAGLHGLNGPGGVRTEVGRRSDALDAQTKVGAVVGLQVVA